MISVVASALVVLGTGVAAADSPAVSGPSAATSQSAPPAGPDPEDEGWG